MTWQVKHSEIDSSVNFYKSYGNSMIECRFVQREQDQIIVYLSSHSGCKQACRFCHLTATGQTDETDVDIDTFCEQLQTVVNYWNTIKTGYETRININWMARGEPLNNKFIVHEWDTLVKRFEEILSPYNLQIKLNISTIIPKVFTSTLTESFAGPIKPNIYYSLYSLDSKFRKRWLPKAKDPSAIINDLKKFKETGGNIIVHQAFINGQNDNIDDVNALVNFVKTNLPESKINIVRYNPYSEKYGKESPVLNKIDEKFNSDFTTQVVPRIGFDAACSCGMFLN